jgi:hypothetical protein
MLQTCAHLWTYCNIPGVFHESTSPEYFYSGLVHISKMLEHSWSVSCKVNLCPSPRCRSTPGVFHAKYKSRVFYSGLLHISEMLEHSWSVSCKVQVRSKMLRTCAHLRDAGALRECFMQSTSPEYFTLDFCTSPRCWNTPGVFHAKYKSGVKYSGLVHISEMLEHSWSVSSESFMQSTSSE